MKTIAIKHDNEIQIDTFDDDKETEVKEFYKGKTYKIVPNKPEGIYELDFNNGVWVNVEEAYNLEHYAELRAKEYPDYLEYIDAQVKKSSSDPAMQEAGLLQEREYLAKCLEIKAKYPKS